MKSMLYQVNIHRIYEGKYVNTEVIVNTLNIFKETIKGLIKCLVIIFVAITLF